MKHLKPYTLFENHIQNNQISIAEFLDKIEIPLAKREQIVEWWNQNRNHIKINYFPFSSPHPIAGVFLGVDTVCFNSKLRMPPHVKLFLSLHESRHCDQHAKGIFMDGYYDTVINKDKQRFLQSYKELEKDANDYAISSMRSIGFEREMDREEMMLRGNENAGPMVYDMMVSDIEKFKAKDFFDLLKKQVL
jgi:hypothetical protein